MNAEKNLQIVTVADLNLFLTANHLSEPHITSANSRFYVYPYVLQKYIEGESPLVRLELIPDEVDFFMPIAVGHIEIARTVIQRVDEILAIDLSKKHPVISQTERRDLLSKIETIFFGSQVMGPEILLPF